MPSCNLTPKDKKIFSTTEATTYHTPCGGILSLSSMTLACSITLQETNRLALLSSNISNSFLPLFSNHKRYDENDKMSSHFHLFFIQTVHNESSTPTYLRCKAPAGLEPPLWRGGDILEERQVHDKS